jgi:hypothetical protein
MTTNFTLRLGLTLALAVPVFGQTIPTYLTKSSSGTTTAMVHFVTSPMQQVRIVSAFATSDLTGSKMTFWPGNTPQTVTVSNVLGTTVTVAATNGFAVGDLVILEKASGAGTNATIASFGSTTNLVFTQNVFATVPGDQVYDAGASPTSLSVGSNSVTLTGDMIYVGNRGRPVVVRVNGTSACSLDAITARYE